MNPCFALISPRTLSIADYIALATYFALNIGIGWWCARRKKASSNDFFLGGGRITWWAAAISFFATATSSITFMAVPAKTYSTDWLSFGSAPAQALAGILMGFCFAGLFRKLNLTTVYGYLEKRFDKRVRLAGAGLGIMMKVAGRMSVVLLLPSLALATVTGMNVYISIMLMGIVTTIYAMEGGFEAVIWTDVLQAGVMLIGVGIALYFAFQGVPDGLSGIVREATGAGKLNAISWDFDLTKPTVWVFVGLFFYTIFSQVSDQPLMQRMLAVANSSEARRTILWGNVIGLGSAVVFFFTGTALWAFYGANPDRLAPGLPNDAIFPYFIANELPAGVVGVIIAGLFAAAMGALSSILNSTAAVVVTDFHPLWRANATDAQRLRLARLSTALCGLCATAMASFLAWRNVASLWDEFIKLMALFGGGFPGVFALGLLSRRANSTGVIIGLVASILVTAWIQMATNTSVFLHGFVAFGTCMIVGYISSLVFKCRKGSTPSLAGLTLWDLERQSKSVTPTVLSDEKNR